MILGEASIHSPDSAGDYNFGFHEDSPIVSVDVKLGKKYQNVDFDYEEFDNEAGRLGLSAEQTSDLNLSITRKRLFLHGGGGLRDGVYKMNVEAGDKTNKCLSHELKHFADFKAGEQTVDKRYIVGKLGFLSVIPITILQVELPVTARMGDKVAQAILNHHLEYLSAVLAMTAIIWGYHFHPEEVSARQAANTTNNHVIRLVKK